MVGEVYHGNQQMLQTKIPPSLSHTIIKSLLAHTYLGLEVAYIPLICRPIHQYMLVLVASPRCMGLV